MNGAEPERLGPYLFALTQEEAKIAGARAGLRAALAGRLSRNHVAPLVAFALLLLFIAILAFTGLVGRRFAEMALLLATIAFMASRAAAHWRLRGVQKTNLLASSALQQAGEARLSADPAGLSLQCGGEERRLAFADCEVTESAGGMVYVWARAGAPIFIPAHAFGDEASLNEFLAFVRARTGRASNVQA